MHQDYYLKISRASDLKDLKERMLYRIFEMLPGLFSLGTIFCAVFFSWKFPTVASFFIIGFSLYWLSRTVYLSFHLRAGYKKMKEHEKIDWLLKLKEFKDWKKLHHLVVVPAYKEPLEILRQTLLSVAHSDYPKEKMIVVLGMERSSGKAAEETAQLLEKEFKKSFFRFLITFHQKNLPGEIPGKGSNESFALKQARELVIRKSSIQDENVIVTSLDADTVVSPSYFSCLSHRYLSVKDPLHTSFQPVPLFLNNIWQAPMFSQIFSFSSTFWHTINQERPEKLITFSSHSMSLKALHDVGFKQTNVVSDDSRIFWQCFLKYDGKYRVEPLYYPMSMDVNAAPTFFQTMFNMYKQQRRWAYGVADIPYFLFGFLKNPRIPFSRKMSLGFELIEGHWSWATSSIILFSLGWLPVALGSGDFSHTLLSYNLPRMTSYMLTIAMLGLVWPVIISISLLPQKPPSYPLWKRFVFAIEWFLFPIAMIFFTALPALDAQIRLMLGRYMGFWSTPKFRGKT
ncbi:MAG: glycosyltransferase family 2 protein [Candidatus Wildermuthbacteria bacterium]|nr:glycosyltransferase family 2 protein [Candidatus Wildermuthbacteria bacterium]